MIQSDQPTLQVELDQEAIDVGETATATVTLSEVPEGGLRGYIVDLIVDTEVATFVDGHIDNEVGQAQWDEETTGTIGIGHPDGDETRARFAASLAEVEAGTTDFEIGVVQIEGQADGATELEVDVTELNQQVDGEYPEIEHTVETTSLTVGDGPSDGNASDGGTAADSGAGADEIPGFGVASSIVGTAGGIGYMLKRRSEEYSESDSN